MQRARFSRVSGSGIGSFESNMRCPEIASILRAAGAKEQDEDGADATRAAVAAMYAQLAVEHEARHEEEVKARDAKEAGAKEKTAGDGS